MPVRLDTFAERHIAAIVAGSQDWPTLAETGSPYWRPRAEAEVRRKVQSMAGPALAPEYNFVILDERFHDDGADLGDQRLIGECSVHGIDYRNRTAELGVCIWDPADRGRSHGRDAVEQLTTWASGYLGMHRLEAHIVVGNDASEQLFTKLGFELEGVQRQRWLCAGQWRDIAIYARLSS